MLQPQSPLLSRSGAIQPSQPVRRGVRILVGPRALRATLIPHLARKLPDGIGWVTYPKATEGAP